MIQQWLTYNYGKKSVTQNGLWIGFKIKTMNGLKPWNYWLLSTRTSSENNDKNQYNLIIKLYKYIIGEILSFIGLINRPQEILKVVCLVF